MNTECTVRQNVLFLKQLGSRDNGVISGPVTLALEDSIVYIYFVDREMEARISRCVLR